MNIVLMVIDTSNIKFCLGKSFENGHMDYPKYKENALGEDSLIRGIAYGRSSENNVEHGFKHALQQLNFQTKFKPASKKRAGSGADVEKWVPWNVQITIDVINAVNTGKIDKVIIGSSEPELVHLIEELASRSIPVTVYACGIPKSFKAAGATCIEITEDMLYSKKETE